MDSKKPHYRVSLSEQALNHKKLEKQSHSLNALQEQQGYSNNDNSLDNSNENTYTPKRRR
ncbi:hypothetical protein EG64_07595 [Helicobacter pylori]|nr:hypothetical protein EG63_07590 [Helicobacter pylori]AHZ30443.1 hypothetical protein EG64_07595 [Helicobacter pylori]